jgi:DNA-binding transcriptional MerR regulator
MSVKTLRFWSDEGLLPPASRSPSGYRMYGEEALIRLDLVRTLRDADVGIETVRKVLRHDLSLADALRLQLSAVDAHVASLQGVAAALRAALRGDPNESDVKRLCAVTSLRASTRDEARNPGARVRHLMALVEHKGAVAVLPAALGALDGWAGLCLLGAAATARTYFPRRSDV